MTCTVINGENVFVVLCTADSMWCDPWSKGLADYLNAIAEREWREYEQMLDLARERELDPPLEEMEPEVMPAELLQEWDAYG